MTSTLNPREETARFQFPAAAAAYGFPIGAPHLVLLYYHTSCRLAAELCLSTRSGSRYLGAPAASGSRSTSWFLAMDGGERPATDHDQKAPLPFVTDGGGDLVELLWQDGAVVAHSQAHAHHFNHHRPLVQLVGAAGNTNTGPSGVTVTGGDAPPPPPAALLPWLPGGGGGGGALGGDVYSQLWQSIAQADGGGRSGGASGGAGSSSRTAGEVGGSSFCGSNNLVAAAPMHLDDDDEIDDDGFGVAAAAAAALPMPLDDPASSGGWNSNAVPKRSRDEFDSRSEDADLDTVDEATPSARRPANGKRRTRAAEVHNMSERRRRDRINEKMRALQELVPNCNKTDKASILDEAIEYLKSLQMQVQIMWMSTGMAPMMIPGAHQLMPPMTMGFNSARMPPPPAAMQFLSQMQRVPPAFMNNLLPNQMPQILPPPPTNAHGVTDRVQSNGMALPRNPFLHPNDDDNALTTPPQVPPGLFGYGPQMVQVDEIQELLTGTAAPALGTELPSSSDGTGT